jgi:hypothetical protein
MNLTASQPVNTAHDDIGEIEVLPPAGLRFGAPAHIGQAALEIDRDTARRLRCPACRRRTMVFEAYTDARGRYSPRARCGDYRCGGSEVL